ncbi:MAG TPA: MlaD family protein [Verrucomicrobiota bacterium]|nr:MlaD family protein [Verrucomicrobiota bacterium]HNU53031.1 MlaD family protein [Verrucomicrobiota bacterium]
MSSARLAWRVGVFVLVGLTLTAVLLIRFSKGFSFVTPTYEVLLKTGNVGGIKPGASVLVAGVQVGRVKETELSLDGRSVVIHLRILRQYRIARDARFVIEQAGFLGDQYVSITPGSGAAPALTDGAVVTCEEPFNLQEAARAAAEFLGRADLTVQQLNDVVARLDRTLLSEASLTGVTETLDHVRRFSVHLADATTTVEGWVRTNAPSLTESVGAVARFSSTLEDMGQSLHATVRTNGEQLTVVLSNLNVAAVGAGEVLEGLRSGEGIAGALLEEEVLRHQFGLTVSNLSVLSSNLARFGLLHKPKAPRTSAPSRTLLPPRRF